MNIKKALCLTTILCTLLSFSACNSNNSNKGATDTSGKESVSMNFDNVSIGDTIKFGSYEQDNINSNGKEVIEWQVLDIKDNKALVISKYTLDCLPYNTNGSAVTWETCSIREWLNNDFYNSAFKSEEKASISETKNKNEDDTDKENDTNDNIFLLNVSEVTEYFSSDSDRECKPTAYAISKNGYEGDNGNSVWWLRFPNHTDRNDDAHIVNDSGDIETAGCCVDVDDAITVRPALWIELD